MRIKKYVLLVDQPGGPLSVLADDLKRLEFRVALVPKREAAFDFIQRFSKLGLVVVNATGKPDYRDIAREAQRLHPSMPVITLDERGCFVELAEKSWGLEGNVGAPELQRQVGEALREQTYPDDVLSALSFSMEEALAGFSTHVATGQAYLRATRGTVCELTALLPFSGNRLSGYLAVGADRDTAIRMHETLFPNADPPEEEDLTDLLGEVCNRAIGRFHELFESRNISFNFGVSLYLTGRSDLRAAQDHPALVLEFEGPPGCIVVELFLDGLIPGLEHAATPAQPNPAGEFVLL
jgi:hypothetical protein